MADPSAEPKTPEAEETKTVDGEELKTPTSSSSSSRRSSSRRSHRSSTRSSRSDGASRHRSGERREHRSSESRSREHRSRDSRTREHHSRGDRDYRSSRRSSQSSSRSGSSRRGSDVSSADREAKRRARASRSEVASLTPGAVSVASDSSPGRRSRQSSSRSQSDRDMSSADQEAKRRARGSRSVISPMTPGAVSVASDSPGSRRIRDKVASGSHRRSNLSSSSMPSPPIGRSGSARSLPGPSTTRTERMSTRAEEEQEIKRRIKEGRSSGSRPQRPSRYDGRISSRNNGDRDSEAKRRAMEGRSSAVTPGAQMAPSRGGEDRTMQKQKMHDNAGGRPGASYSTGGDASKSKEKEKEKMSGEPMGAPPGMGDGDEEVAVEAVAIDEEAEENERMRALEEQNRALAERMEQLINNPVPNNEEGQVTNNNKDKEGDDDESTVEENEKSRNKKRIICILVVLVLAIVGGIAAYFLTKSSEVSAATTLIAPAEDRTVTPAPMVPVVPDTQPPTIMDSASPSSSPTIDTYDPPSLQDCIRVKGGLPIEGQDDLEMSPFRMAFDVTLTDPNLPIGTWVPTFKEGIDKVLIPALTGCPIDNRRLGSDLVDSTELEQRVTRGLQEVDSPIRYVIANAKASINPDRDVTDNCEIQRSGCKNTRVILEFFLKGEEKGFDIITLVAQVLQYLVDLENGNRQLQNTVEELRYHRKLLATIFGFDPDIIASLDYRGIENMDPTTSPSISPSRVPSIVPTVRPSGVPSASPSLAPTTVAPTGRPTEGPTKFPTRRPTPGPTPFPTRNPTPPPTPRPTPSPTPRPVESPTPQPVNPPTPQPFSSPSEPCTDDLTFRDFGGDDCSWYVGEDVPGCPDTGDYSGTCGTMSSCSAMDACCICNGDGPGCVDDDTFEDDDGDDCQWYRENDTAGCPNYGTSWGGTCAINLYTCYARDACCHCSSW